MLERVFDGNAGSANILLLLITVLRASGLDKHPKVTMSFLTNVVLEALRLITGSLARCTKMDLLHFNTICDYNLNLKLKLTMLRNISNLLKFITFLY